MQRHRQASGGSSSCTSVTGLRVPSSPAPPTPLLFPPLPSSLSSSSSSHPPTSSSLPPPPPALPPPPCRCSSALTQRTRMWQIKLKCQCPVMRWVQNTAATGWRSAYCSASCFKWQFGYALNHTSSQVVYHRPPRQTTLFLSPSKCVEGPKKWLFFFFFF